MKDITTDLGQGIDFDQMINDALKLDERFVLSDVMTNCKASKTLFTALNIKQETEIMGFSISSIKDEVDTVTSLNFRVFIFKINVLFRLYNNC